MRVTLWKNRFALAALTFFVVLIVLVSSQHRLRLIVGTYKTVDSSARLDASEPIRSMVPIDPRNGGGFSLAIATLQSFDRTHSSRPGDAMPAIDQPDTCERLMEEGRMLHCYNVDIGASVLLARENIATRLWDICGNGELGGNGHNLIEVFDGPSKSWKALDPYYHCYFTLNNDIAALDFPSLRRALLTAPSTVRIVRYTHLTPERPDSFILSELHFLAPGAMLHANNDFRWRYLHRYGWLTPLAAPLFDASPLRVARGIRMLMLGSDDLRYIVNDSYTPRYPIRQMKWLFWGTSLLFGISFLGTLVASVRAAHAKRTETHRTRLHSAPVSEMVSL